MILLRMFNHLVFFILVHCSKSYVNNSHLQWFLGMNLYFSFCYLALFFTLFLKSSFCWPFYIYRLYPFQCFQYIWISIKISTKFIFSERRTISSSSEWSMVWFASSGHLGGSVTLLAVTGPTYSQALSMVS